MFNSIKHHVHTALCTHHPQQAPFHLHFPPPLSTSTHVPPRSPSGCHRTVVCVCVLCIYVNLFTFFHLLSSSPPSPFPSDSSQSDPCVHASVSTLFLSLFVHQIPHMCEITRYLSTSDWLISLSIIFSRSIHVTIKGKISFFILTAE